MPEYSKEDLRNLRHTGAHLLAMAVKDLYPGAQNAIGPAIDDGFYQDFDLGEHTISEEDLPKIQKMMKELVKDWGAFEEREVSADEAKELFADNPYKLELIDDFATEGKEITVNNPGTFLDLCKGGHFDNASKHLRHFKLLSTAGAYWRGDHSKQMLTRIYGTAFFTKEDLTAHLTMLEEAKKRDHRKLGQQLDLFTFSPLVGPGLPLWTPRGTLVRNLLDEFVWQLRQERGYTRVEIPHITKKELFETSGHWEKFQDELFKITTREGHQFAMKPMNCPFHTQIFDRKKHSYREMPQRYANTTTCYRDEQTGELQGLSRVRAFSQDDAHVFCRESQFVEEALKIWDIIEAFYGGTGFGELTIRLSLRDPATPEKYQGSDELWERSEQQLRELISQKKADAVEAPGEAAFYGPKIDFLSKDSLGREWQVATIQADRTMPENFDLACINEAGERERIVMIHAAIMGSIERFMSVLLEHHAGALPLWLSPVQVAVLPISDDQLDYAQSIVAELQAGGMRAESDTRSESSSKKIREAETMKVPVMLIVGKKEAEAGSVSVRSRVVEETDSATLPELQEQLTQALAERR